MRNKDGCFIRPSVDQQKKELRCDLPGIIFENIRRLLAGTNRNENSGVQSLTLVFDHAHKLNNFRIEVRPQQSLDSSQFFLGALQNTSWIRPKHPAIREPPRLPAAYLPA